MPGVTSGLTSSESRGSDVQNKTCSIAVSLLVLGRYGVCLPV